MFDGKVARTKKDRTEQEKSFGIQIDSLSDLVSFGVLPAVIGFAMVSQNYHISEYPYRIETMLHNHFSAKNVLNEWFDLSHEDVVNFRNICKIMEERIKCLEDNPFFMKQIH
jgi:hypothetical protein